MLRRLNFRAWYLMSVSWIKNQGEATVAVLVMKKWIGCYFSDA
jgi:hypothetical protein